MATPQDLVTSALSRWRNNLIDLSRRNPLLSLKPNRTSYLEIVQPELAKVYEYLLIQGKSWSFHFPPEAEKGSRKKGAAPAPASTAIKKEAPASLDAAERGTAVPAPSGAGRRASELLTAEPDRHVLLKILTNLHRRAWADYRERGLQILYLALGVLEWRDEGDETFRSPLVLVPVKLERVSLKDPFQLLAIDDDPIVNPALAARLKQDFDFRLPPPPEDWTEKKPDQYLDEVRGAIAGLPGWEVQPTIVLTWCSFFKGVIFQDLHENLGQAQAHPVVQMLAGTPAPVAKLPSLDEHGLDARQDPQQTYHILDADGSQRLCLEGAARGESFVLIGPPGTGKSQTIANLIADRIANGMKVLFVSEKMAALEVVYKRLCAVGLGEFCLELHSHRANKREVIKELARCYEESAAPRPQPSADDFARLKQRRDHLNRYVQALHQERAPMGKSVWQALADLPRWQHVPMVPLSDAAAPVEMSHFSAAHLDELQQLLQRLQHHWHIRTDRAYPWRGFKAERYTLQLRDDVVGILDKIRDRGDKLRAAAERYSGLLGIRGPIAELLRLGDLLEKRPPGTMPDWLTTPDLAPLLAEFETCADQYQRLGQARNPLTERYGETLWKQPPGTAARVAEAWKSAAARLLPEDRRGAAFLRLNHNLRAWTAETQKRVPAWLTELRTLEKWLDAPVPPGAGAAPGEKFDPSVGAVRALLRLASFGIADALPDRTWLEDRQRARDALEIITTSKEAFLRYKKNRLFLLRTYDEKLFDLDLVRIGRAFAGWYRNWLSIFSWQRFKDRRAIARCRAMEDLPRTVADDMQIGAQVQTDRERLQADAPRRAQLLGRYEKGLETDIEAAERAARHAVETHDLALEMDCDRLPAKTLDALAAGSSAEKIRGAVKRLAESFAAWMHLTQEVQALLPTASLPSVNAPLDDVALSALLQVAKQLQAALNQFGGLADPLLGTNPPTDMEAFLADLRQAEELLGWERAQATEAARHAKLFGPGFQGVGTEWDHLRKALTWTRLVREGAGRMGGAGAPPLAGAFLDAAMGTPPSSRELRNALAPYEQELHHFEVRFDAPGPLLDGKPLRETTPEKVLEILAVWRERVGELADWIDWRYLPEHFGRYGLKSFWDRLQQHDIVREQVVDLFHKAFWSAWLDAHFQAEPILSQYRREEHERLVREFRELDRKILQQTAARIVARLDPVQSARATSDAEITLLMREAHKKTRHLPLRQLFDAMPTLLMRLKPCLLMSPLSVSQFLPADHDKVNFDLVVFDEASQILPEDAVAAIYRGKQLVVTGDNQQLPPTSFFQQSADDPTAEDETPLFESVLDACLGAGLPQRMLRWHYRSQDERLIAFSNETYYEGRLLTFPSAVFAHPSLGVQFHHVPDGVYDRGGRRDNPREAEVVASLVLEHFRTTPDKTLGVIAFSYAQMNAIEDELDRQLESQPELERFFKGDRLEGFFVKNLETVQGDERDVILLSVGYGRDAQGRIELNFGPLNREGGERRLNVAVTRARQRLILVSSIRARDLRLNEGQAKGLAHLQRYLDFAENGIAALSSGAAGVRLPLSGLHEDVLRELKNLGFDGEPMVGCGLCRLDIGVRDPRDPGRFLLGIEFDGPMHAQVSTARDRDRLRFEVLQRLGWKLHRIGSPDWVYRREEELTRLRAALSLSEVPSQ